ncbi:MAG: hypothetical protein INR62_02195, partial [Rhodospirillales bacterium]|nr:hypothetical protein [Acetobacter sp.]
MKRAWELSLKLAAGTLCGALCAMPQGYTISARPGVINYVEGKVDFNERPLNSGAVGRTFLNA